MLHVPRNGRRSQRQTTVNRFGRRTRSRKKPPQEKHRMGRVSSDLQAAGVWSPVTIDPKRHAIYFVTGNTFSDPDVGRSDAIMALDLDTGKILWIQQDEAKDVWHTGCPQGTRASRFPAEEFSRAVAPALRAPDVHRCRLPITVRIQKVRIGTSPRAPFCSICRTAGACWSPARNPDWSGHTIPTRTAPWFGDRTYPAARSCLAEQRTTRKRTLPCAEAPERSAGLAAVQLSDGVEKWFTPIPPQESMSTHAGITAGVTVIPGAVFTAGLDGMLRAFATLDGRPLWQYDTTQEVQTVNGVKARGGSIGSAGTTIVNGMVYVTSGYTGFQGGSPGNMLLAFAP